MQRVAAALLVSGAVATHYEDPKNGCGSDEQAIKVQGVSGDFCSPKCQGTTCPTDPPSASDAHPQCALKSPTGDQYCALLCTPGSNAACPEGATCQPIQGVGLCTYPSAGLKTEVHELAPAINAAEEDSKPKAPQQPHLAQAWTAQSIGDGQPGQVGTEHYIYEDFKGTSDPYALQGHIFDYGSSCKKIELVTKDLSKAGEAGFLDGTFYINCDAVDCCYDGDGSPDIKKWDIASPGLLHSVRFAGVEDTTELGNKTVKGAEHWEEIDRIPFAKNFSVQYDYYITRNGKDIISHRIDYKAPGQIGSILYGDFQPQQNVSAFRETFKIPKVCYPQGEGGHAMACDGNKIRQWEKKYFHSGVPAGKAQPSIVV